MSGYQIWGIVLLILFYGVYAWKNIGLYRKGYPVFALGKRMGNKETETLRIEWLLLICTVAIGVMECVSLITDRARLESPVIRTVGIVVCFFGLCFLLLSMIAMGRTWRVGITGTPQRRLVTRGIFAVTRNPAFLGFGLFYIGYFLLFANLVHLCLLVLSLGLIHMQILEEEKYLRATFGPAFAAYCHKTARYLIF